MSGELGERSHLLPRASDLGDQELLGLVLRSLRARGEGSHVTESEGIVEGLTPGSVCPTCQRRVKYPKKASSPETAEISYHVPVDEKDAHKVVLKEAAKHLGTSGRPHERFWTVTYALAAVLQDESLRGVGQRSPIA